MRTAVIRVNLNPAGDLPDDQLAAAVEDLKSSGLEVIAPDFGQVPAHSREIELLLPGEDTAALSAWAADRCARALGAPGPVAGAATFLSRGTDEDALGVVSAFGLTATVERAWNNDQEIVTITIPRADARRVPESRLHTALEAALNAEVRLLYA
ncbi:MAG TPA: hypothetical protein VMU95_26650 [Trebonia sp.]|nr:hypothetical protein [Trebonia sp.]